MGWAWRWTGHGIPLVLRRFGRNLPNFGVWDRFLCILPERIFSYKTRNKIRQPAPADIEAPPRPGGGPPSFFASSPRGSPNGRYGISRGKAQSVRLDSPK